ncbi:hypothetical protein V5O48_013794 [Marasmius crinis-equi]|uniref:Uncharacterized protein n=1 Tax=Marasmius crinis-equi TaxID=585013 RepID=A0ABR3EZ34_9AGAR
MVNFLPSVSTIRDILSKVWPWNMDSRDAIITILVICVFGGHLLSLLRTLWANVKIQFRKILTRTASCIRASFWVRGNADELSGFYPYTAQVALQARRGTWKRMIEILENTDGVIYSENPAEDARGLHKSETSRLNQIFRRPWNLGSFTFSSKERQREYKTIVQEQLQPVLLRFVDSLADRFASNLNQTLPRLYPDTPHFDILLGAVITHSRIMTELQPLLENVLDVLGERWKKSATFLPNDTEAEAGDSWIQQEIIPALDRVLKSIKYPNFRGEYRAIEGDVVKTTILEYAGYRQDFTRRWGERSSYPEGPSLDTAADQLPGSPAFSFGGSPESTIPKPFPAFSFSKTPYGSPDTTKTRVPQALSTTPNNPFKVLTAGPSPDASKGDSPSPSPPRAHMNSDRSV